MKSLCPLPWSSLFVETNGIQKICCRSSLEINTKDFDFNHNEINKIRLKILNNEFPKSCSYCYQSEKHNGPSLRKDALKSHPNSFVNNLKSITNNDGSTSQFPFSLSLVVGNKCNLKCIMCMPQCSSMWFKETFPGKENEYDWTKDEEYFNKVLEFVKKSSENNNGIVIWISGGEFTLNKNVEKLFQYVIDNDLSNISFDLLSNGTSMPSKMEKLLESISTRLNISIDAVGEKNDFIRKYSNFNNIEKNIEKVKHLIDSIYITITSVNILDIDEIVLWCDEKGFKTHFEIAYGPHHHLNPLLLPEEVREFAAKKLTSLSNLKHTNSNDVQGLAEKLRSGKVDYYQFEKFKNIYLKNDGFLELFFQWKKFV